MALHIIYSPPCPVLLKQHVCRVKVAVDDVALVQVAHAACDAHREVEHSVLG